MPDPALKQIILQDGEVAVSMLNYGAITRAWTIGGVPMVRSLPRAEDYLTDGFSTGVIAGRVANRTAGGRFMMNGQPYQLSRNEGRHHLHGGLKGLGKRFWHIEPDGAQAVRLGYHSPDGEEGYPGRVDFTLDIRLSGHSLTYDMRALPDRPTPINLAQHSYYTLGEAGLIWGAELALAADRTTPADGEGIPTGDMAKVSGSSLDFRAPRQLGPADAALDTNFLFSASRSLSDPVATLSANGYILKMWSDQPGLQVYAGAGLPAPNTALCLEPQAPPNAVNQAGFPPIIATPEKPYRQWLKVEISKPPA